MELSLVKPLSRKPLMLKDYLLDDLSSCSSSGFRSYPRRQCCTTVGFLLEIDLKTKPPKYKKRPILQSPLKPASTTVSAFQRASEAVINAVKHLPFASLKPSPSSSKLKLGILRRSLSRKLLKRSFWKRNDHKEIHRWKPIEHLVEEISSPLPDFIITVTDDSHSSTSKSNSKSNSWTDSDFFTTSDDSLQCSTANSATKSPSKIREEVVVENNKKRLPKDKVVSSKRAGVTVGGDDDDSIDVTTSSNRSTKSPNTTKKQWPNEEKEQFSPVSVLDCRFDDDDDEVSSSSPFQHRLARMEGAKKRLMKKIRRFERLTQLEQVNLVKRIALSESDQDSNGSPLHHSSGSTQEDSLSDIDEVEEENKAEEKALELLELIKDRMPSISINFNVEKPLLDFFKLEMDNSSENAIGLTSEGVKVTVDDELLHIAKDWLNGLPVGQLLEWKVQNNREAYIHDMERGGEWRKLDKEKQEVTLEVEVEVFASLMNELLVDLFSS